jgi:hypothetical protein
LINDKFEVFVTAAQAAAAHKGMFPLLADVAGQTGKKITTMLAEKQAEQRRTTLSCLLLAEATSKDVRVAAVLAEKQAEKNHPGWAEEKAEEKKRKQKEQTDKLSNDGRLLLLQYLHGEYDAHIEQHIEAGAAALPVTLGKARLLEGEDAEDFDPSMYTMGNVIACINLSMEVPFATAQQRAQPAAQETGELAALLGLGLSLSSTPASGLSLSLSLARRAGLLFAV